MFQTFPQAVVDLQLFTCAFLHVQDVKLFKFENEGGGKEFSLQHEIDVQMNCTIQFHLVIHLS